MQGTREDADLAAQFKGLYEELDAKQDTILEELNSVQGQPVDIGGYYYSDPKLRAEVMRPSATFNAIIDAVC